ncbi:MAG: hypothetical protein MIO93_00325 [ANME-2 cluster archaeon]|jgi:glutaredoxin-related protein|nr:hypothetical protein [ANME-2 cluster archaeon]
MSAIENCNINASTSSVAIDEITYILLKFKAVEILDTHKHYKVRVALRHDRNVFDEAWEVAQKHIDYVDAFNILCQTLKDKDTMTSISAFFSRISTARLPSVSKTRGRTRYPFHMLNR